MVLEPVLGTNQSFNDASEDLQLLHHRIMLTRQANLRFAPVGKCIYCPADQAHSVLTEEHVLPDGLNGHLILPAASCLTCQRHIHRFETRVINDCLNLGRAKLGIRSKKGLKRGGIKTSASGNGIDYFPVAADMPSIVAVSHYNRRAALLTGDYSCGPNEAANQYCWKDIKPESGKVGVRVRAGDFTRFIAKVAHGYTVAALGYGRFKPFLLEHILGPGEVGVPKYLGILPTPETELDVLHDVSLRLKTVSAYPLPRFPAVKKRLAIVYLQLFICGYEIPTYEVVSGEVVKEWQELS